MATTTAQPDLQHDRPLAEVIAIATRSVHFKLNKLIIAKLPAALPPRASDPSSYISGLLHIAPIYITFEALWQNILDTPPTTHAFDKTDGQQCSDTSILESDISTQHDRGQHHEPRVHRPVVPERMHSALRQLHLSGLMRSQRLRADLAELTRWPDHVVEDQLRAVSQMGRLGEFVKHIKRSIENKPHVLLAYSYILYMALFAGGRFMRASLESVGDAFWDHIPSPVKPTLRPCEAAFASEPDNTKHASAAGKNHDSRRHRSMPLRFFHFPTPLDGEDLRREFKKRLSESDAILTPKERHDIVQESVCIFDNVSLIVQQLDLLCSEPGQEDSDGEGSVDAFVSLLNNPLANRFRDSVVVTRERHARGSSKRSSSGDGDVASLTNGSREVQPHHHQIPSPDSLPLNPHLAHPVVPNMANIEFCPGFAKSMRFEKALAKPVHMPPTVPDAGIELAGSLKMATKRVRGMHITNWVMMAAFGAMILGAILTGRRGVLGV